MMLVNRVLLASLLLIAVLAPSAEAWFRTPATRFATLPPGAAHPEGITVDDIGNVYVTTFAVEGTPTGNGQLFVFNKHGRLLRQVNVAGSSTLLLDRRREGPHDLAHPGVRPADPGASQTMTDDSDRARAHSGGRG